MVIPLLLKSLTTTAFAPIAISLAILTLPIILAPLPINTLFPITGASDSPFVAPMVTLS